MFLNRELLMSLLASAMLTSPLLPTSHPVNRAGVLDPVSVGHALNLALSHAPAGYSRPAVAPVSGALIKTSASTAPSSSQLRQLVRVALGNPDETAVAERITVPLGLAQPGVRYTVKQLIYNSDDVKHFLAADSGGGAKVLFMRVENGVATLWVSDMNGKLLAAGVMQNRVVTVVDISSAQTAFEEELLGWGRQPLPAEIASNS